MVLIFIYIYISAGIFIPSGLNIVGILRERSVWEVGAFVAVAHCTV